MGMRISFIEGIVAKKKPAIAGFFKLRLKRVLRSHHDEVLFVKNSFIEIIIFKVIAKVCS